jgi:predicted extracellular nuclease
MKTNKQIIWSAGFLIMALVLLLALSGIALAQSTPVFINEIHYDNTGGDTDEAVEIAGSADTDLSGWSLVLYNGNGGTVYDTIPLSGLIPDQQDGFGTLSFAASGLQNGSPDGLALVDAGNNVVQFLSYEGTFTAVGGPADGLTSADIGVAEPSDTPVGQSLQLIGTGSVYEDFAWTGPVTNTFGGINTGQTGSGVEPTPTPTPPPLPDIVINEVDADQVSTDSAEFVELYDGGVGNTDLTGLTLVLFNGSDDASYLAFDLDGQSTDGDGYFVLCGNAANVANCDLDVSPDTNLIQNGADAVAIYPGDATDFPNDTPVTTTDLIDAMVYDTDDGDDAGLLVLLNAGQPQVNEAGGGDATAHSNQRCPNGTGGARNTDTYAQFVPTPGAENTCTIPMPDVIINEVDADQVSTDSAEFIELYDGGMGNTALDGLVLVLFNGSDDASYASFDLDGQSTDGDGYFVLCGNAATTANCDLDVSPDTNLIQNGADAVALLVGDAADFPNDTPLTTDGLLDAIVYDTNDGDDAGLLVLLNPGQPQVNEAGGGDATAHANQRCPNGQGGTLNTDTYTQAAPSPGATNNCPLPFTAIYDIQYTTDPSGDSPFKDQSNITTEGLVTARFYNGYFIEDPAGGAWNALWVYDSANTPALGDLVRVTGTVIEYNNLTELSNLTAYEFVSGGNALPAPVVLSTVNVSQEQWEGVLVRVENVTVINDSLGYGEWSVSDGSGDVVIDDKGDYTYAPANGDSLDFIIGPLDYSYGAFKIQPRDDDDLSITQPPFTCGDPATFIHTIQGSGPASPEEGNNHVIEGVVVGDFQTGDHLRGFFLQEEDVDADVDPMTSEGIFVYDGSSPAVDVSVGDVVRVQGEVVEYYGLTELTNISNIAVCSGTATATAATVQLPVSSLDQWEWYEGMLINIPQTLYATGNYYQGRYGEVDLSVGDRLDNPTNVVAPGPDAVALQELNDRSRIQLEDGRTAENPSPAPYIGDGGTLRAGDTIPDLTGVLHYAYGAYELHPTETVNFTRVNTRDATPLDVGGTLKVASFNVLNYFTTLDGSGDICGPLGNLGCRGADNAFEFTRQRDKIIAAITIMDADVIGLMEMENHPADVALQDLVTGLNDVAGPGTYAAVNTGPIGTDAIKVAFIYKPGAVTPVGSSAVLDTPAFVDPNGTGQGRNRPALAQTFADNASGQKFTAVVNHFKSKGASGLDEEGSICLTDPGSNPDCDQGDGQGYWNDTRTDAALALVAWLQTDPTGSDDPNFLIIGDLNAYAMEDPVTTIKSASYTNLVESFIGPDAYSYVFSGQSGYLDHALADPSMSAQVTGVTEWHINTDEPAALDYNDYNQPELYQPDQYRASDHDPVLIGLNLVPQCAGQNATVYVDGNGVIVGGLKAGQLYDNELWGTCGNDIIVGTTGNESIFGLKGDDLICGLEGDDSLRGQRGSDALYGGAGNDVLIGMWGIDILNGGDGNDYLDGGYHDDTLNGGAGDDILRGRAGEDVCDGGPDTDVAKQCETEINIP